MINSEQLSAALQRLDPRDWEVLDLSLRRRVPDEALARLFATEPPEVARRRAFAIEHLADELGVQRGEDLGAVLKALLEPATWEEAEREHADGWQGFPDPQGAPGPARPPGEDPAAAQPVAREPHEGDRPSEAPAAREPLGEEPPVEEPPSLEALGGEPSVEEPPSSEPPAGELPDEPPPAPGAPPAQEPPPAETAAPAEPPRSSETARHFRLTPPPELPPLDMERDRPAAEGQPGADDESPVWPPASRAGRGAAAPASAAHAEAEPPPELDGSAPSEAGEPEPPASPPPAGEPSPARPAHLAAVPPAAERPASAERDAAEEEPADETPVAERTEEGGGEKTPAADRTEEGGGEATAAAEKTEEGGDEGPPAAGAPAQDEPAEEQGAADESATAEEERDLDEASPPPPAQAPSEKRSAAPEAGDGAVPRSPEPVLDMLAERDQEERRQRIRTPVLWALAGGLGAVGLFAAGYVGAHWFGGGDTQRAGGGGDGPRRFLPSALGPMAQPFPSDPRDASCYPTAAIDRDVNLYQRPGSRKTLKLPARTEWDSPRVLSVVRRRGDWLAVLAPELKNGEVGWMRSKGAKLDCVRWSLHVDLSKRRLYVRKDGHTMRKLTIAVGSSSHPTPKGRFAVTDKLKVVDKGSPYGCCVLALTGHQTRLPPDWPGGDRLAVHATSDLSSIGKPVSLGCMRSQPSQVDWLIKTVPLGAPVFIRS